MSLPECCPSTIGVEMRGEGSMGIPTERCIEPDAVPYDLLCTICLGVVSDDAVQTPCGHIYCRECIRSSLRRQAVCPQDRKALSHGQLRLVKEANPIVRRIWGAIKVRCCYAERGECKWTGNLGDALSHEARCARKLGSPRDLKIRELDGALARSEARLAEAVAERQDAARRAAHLEGELKRRTYDFDQELAKQAFDARSRLDELQALAADRESQLAALSGRFGAVEGEHRRLGEAHAALSESHTRLLGEREAREAAAQRHVEALQGQLSELALDSKAMADDFGQRQQQLERQRGDLEQELHGGRERTRHLEFQLEAAANDARTARGELADERNRSGAELERARGDAREASEQLFHVQRQLDDAEQRLHEAREERAHVYGRLEMADRDLDASRRGQADAEEALARAEKHFQGQLDKARDDGRHDRGGAHHFDRAYKYDRNSVVKLAQLVAAHLEDRPSEISPNRVFSCVGSCYEDLKRGWTDNPSNYAIDVRMLLSVATASTWFNEQQQQLLDQWQRDEGWLGNRGGIHVVNSAGPPPQQQQRMRGYQDESFSRHSRTPP
ncbi:hypothetical protein SO694_0003515 [Aureococcus anophagefferens]|uniref:RING-type domain-containing protein n=1 Tax=Aureococcus anophagefferens TaxID=44056 RepID=A0ABR1FKK9_AURAN